MTVDSLFLIVSVDKLRDRVDVLLRRRRAGGDRRQVRLARQDHVLKRLHFPPQPMRLAIRVVERSVHREDRDVELRQIDCRRCAARRGAAAGLPAGLAAATRERNRSMPSASAPVAFGSASSIASASAR